MLLHPQVQALLDLTVQRGIPPTHTLSPEQARSAYLLRGSLVNPPSPQVALVCELTADGPAGQIPLRLYRPVDSVADHVLPVLVWFHGGGWVIGDLDSHDVLCRELANLSGCAVVAVDYRLAPEHPFPAAVDDVMAATQWVHDHAADLHLDASRLAVGGDSAGGNLAAVVAILARDQGNLPIAFQLLIYPVTDLQQGHASHTSNGQGYSLTTDTLNYFYGHYVVAPQAITDWRASPLLHDDHTNLPPALVITAGYDPLRDEGRDYALALTAAGGRASYACFERQIHGFIGMGGVLDEANAAVALCAGELKRALKA
ncbi:alpha/beta hydrolase [Alcaligenaceae bacterium]|nr:alpha/beta hydrolase [Alcaligenaceae bacterium]